MQIDERLEDENVKDEERDGERRRADASLDDDRKLRRRVDLREAKRR